jgi:hypothetical protein
MFHAWDRRNEWRNDCILQHIWLLVAVEERSHIGRRNELLNDWRDLLFSAVFKCLVIMNVIILLALLEEADTLNEFCFTPPHEEEVWNYNFKGRWLKNRTRRKETKLGEDKKSLNPCSVIVLAEKRGRWQSVIHWASQRTGHTPAQLPTREQLRRQQQPTRQVAAIVSYTSNSHCHPPRQQQQQPQRLQH